MSPVNRGAAAALVSQEPAGGLAHEFSFSEADFRHLTQLAYEYAGIALADNKRNLVYSRVSRRLRALRLTSFREYREFLASDRREVESFINSISTNHTKFFREEHHFDHFRAHVVLPFAQSGGKNAGGRLRSLVGRLLERRGALHDCGRPEARDSRLRRLRRPHSCDRYRHRCLDQSGARRIPGAALSTRFPKPYHSYLQGRGTKTARSTRS